MRLGPSLAPPEAPPRPYPEAKGLADLAAGAPEMTAGNG